MKNPEIPQFKQKLDENNKQEYNMLSNDSQEKILSGFSESERIEIEKKRKTLSALAYFIGKDFEIPVELNKPGQGWHWDFKENKIRIDPKDLLEKSMDYLRFVISREGGHRRISRTEFIPLEEWKEPGFSFMMNTIEDPRDNNFVAENYPRFKKQMALAYEHNLDIEHKSKEKAQEKLGYQPRFMQAGFEYIKQWYRERNGEDVEISGDLPEEVKEVVQKTLAFAQDSWLRFPTKKMADGQEKDETGLTGEPSITAHAKVSYEINRDKIWPEFKKLVDEDMKDQKMQELMNDMKQEKAEDGGGQGLPQEMKDKLTPEEQKEIEEAIEKAFEDSKKQEAGDGEKGKADDEKNEEGGGKKEDSEDAKEGKSGVPIDLNSLSDELKQKIKEYIDSLSEEKRKELEEKTEQSLGEFSEELADDIGGKLSDNPKKKKERADKGEEINSEQDSKTKKDNNKEEVKKKKELEEKKKKDIENTLRKIKERTEGDLNDYQKKTLELKPQINRLKNKLWKIFQSRRKRGMKTGFYDGEEFDVERRMQEKAKDIKIYDSMAWRRTELPKEKDYAISLLIDLSGSMDSGNKIEEAFNSCVLFTEVLNALRIRYEVLGFNDRIYEYKDFDQELSVENRKKIITMKKEVSSSHASYNDDGWALKQAVERLKIRQEKEKLLLVISDGNPEPSKAHNGEEYNLHNIISSIMREKEIKLAGLGLGSSGIEAVKEYYPKHLMAKNSKEMIEQISTLLVDLIEKLR